VISTDLKAGKTVLVVGHENNLRSLIMKMEGIEPCDIINLSLPRAVPLVYTLDSNLNPMNPRRDGGKDKATGFLTGEWLGGDEAVKDTLERDNKNVYDLDVEGNLEIKGRGEKEVMWREWKKEIERS